MRGPTSSRKDRTRPRGAGRVTISAGRGSPLPVFCRMIDWLQAGVGCKNELVRVIAVMETCVLAVTCDKSMHQMGTLLEADVIRGTLSSAPLHLFYCSAPVA